MKPSVPRPCADCRGKQADYFAVGLAAYLGSVTGCGSHGRGTWPPRRCWWRPSARRVCTRTYDLRQVVDRRDLRPHRPGAGVRIIHPSGGLFREVPSMMLGAAFSSSPPVSSCCWAGGPDVRLARDRWPARAPLLSAPAGGRRPGPWVFERRQARRGDCGFVDRPGQSGPACAQPWHHRLLMYSNPS